MLVGTFDGGDVSLLSMFPFAVRRVDAGGMRVNTRLAIHILPCTHAGRPHYPTLPCSITLIMPIFQQQLKAAPAPVAPKHNNVASGGGPR
jgi:hypothetical protein